MASAPGTAHRHGRPARSRVAVAVLAVLAVLLTACGGGGSAEGGASAGPLRIGSVVFPSSLDPAIGTGGSDHMVLYLIYDRLIDQDPETGELRPGLAESWAYDETDRRRFTLELRDGVTFQDGTPLDAAAVVASLQRYQELGINTELTNVTGIEAVDAMTVAITLTAEDAALPAILSDRPGMITSPAAVAEFGDEFAQHPTGTGPFTVDQIVSGSSITFDEFADYWGDEPEVDRIEWTTYPQVVAMENAAKGGQLDLAVQIPAADVASLEDNPNFTVDVGPSLAYTDVVMIGDLDPFDSPEIRLAFNHAINREALLQAVNDGEGEIATQALGSDSPYYSDAAAEYTEYDPEKARDLVAASGKQNPTFECAFFPGRGVEVAGPLMINDLAEVGMTMTLKQLSLAQALSDFRERRVPCLFTSWTGRPDPSLTFALNFASTGSSNVGKVDLGVDDLIAQLRSTYDEDERARIGQEIAEKVAPVTTQVPLLRTSNIVLVGSKVQGYLAPPSGKPDLRTVSLGG